MLSKTIQLNFAVKGESDVIVLNDFIQLLRKDDTITEARIEKQVVTCDFINGKLYETDQFELKLINKEGCIKTAATQVAPTLGRLLEKYKKRLNYDKQIEVQINLSFGSNDVIPTGVELDNFFQFVDTVKERNIPKLKKIELYKTLHSHYGIFFGDVIETDSIYDSVPGLPEPLFGDTIREAIKQDILIKGSKW